MFGIIINALGIPIIYDPRPTFIEEGEFNFEDIREDSYHMRVKRKNRVEEYEIKKILYEKYYK